MAGIPAVPIDCIDAIRIIDADLDSSMIRVSQRHGAKKVSMSNIADFFFRQCGIPTQNWNFCDSLFVRYFAKVPSNLYVGKDFSSHAACFITCLCISDSSLLPQHAIDVYADGDDGAHISFGRCRLFMQNIFDMTGGDGDRMIEETYEKFMLYVRANPKYSITVNVPNVSIKVQKSNDDTRIVQYSDECNLVPTESLISFFTKKHRFLLWPLVMLKAQLQQVFMGEDFWDSLKSAQFFGYLKAKKVTNDIFWFTEVLQKMYNTSIAKMKQQGTLSARPFQRKNQSPKVSLIRKTKKKRSSDGDSQQTDRESESSEFSASSRVVKNKAESPLMGTQKLNNLPIKKMSNLNEKVSREPTNANITDDLPSKISSDSLKNETSIVGASTKSQPQILPFLNIAQIPVSENIPDPLRGLSRVDANETHNIGGNQPSGRSSPRIIPSLKLSPLQPIGNGTQSSILDLPASHRLIIPTENTTENARQMVANLEPLDSRSLSSLEDHQTKPSKSQKLNPLHSPASLAPLPVLSPIKGNMYVALSAVESVSSVISSTLSKLASKDDSHTSIRDKNYSLETDRKHRNSLSNLPPVNRQSSPNLLESPLLNQIDTSTKEKSAPHGMSERRFKRLESFEKNNDR